MTPFVRPLAALAGLLISAAALAGPAAAAPAPAASTVHFTVLLDSPCFVVDGPKRTKGVVTVRTPGGRIRAQIQLRLDGEGSGFDCFFGLLTGINGGDSITFKSDSVRRRWSIPELSVTADRVTDSYRVDGPAGARVGVSGMRGAITGQQTVLFGDDQVVVGPDGDVSGAPGVDLLGADAISAILARDGDMVVASAYVPFVLVQIGDRLVRGAVEPDADVRVTLARDGRTIARSVGANLVAGQFYATLAGPDGRPVYVLPGDRVTVLGDRRITMKVPRIQVRGSAATDTVSGRCLPEGAYGLRVEAPFRSPRFLYVQMHGKAAADGTFTRHPRNEDLRVGDEIDLTCMNANGDVTTLQRLVAS